MKLNICYKFKNGESVDTAKEMNAEEVTNMFLRAEHGKIHGGPINIGFPEDVVYKKDYKDLKSIEFTFVV